MLDQLSIVSFLTELGSDTPTPGGGSASALAGALAGALVQMVARLSEKSALEEKRIKEIMAEAEALTEALTELINDDAQAFNEVMAAYKMPKSTSEEKKARSAQIQKATRQAATVPLQAMEVTLKILFLVKEAISIGNQNALSDAMVAGFLGCAGIRGAACNVSINLGSLRDRDFVDKTNRRMEEMLSKVEVLEKTLVQRFDLLLKGGG